MLISSILTTIGLALFESVTSIDNAIINAEALGTMQPRARRWFLTWGMLLAVFGVRGWSTALAYRLDHDASRRSLAGVHRQPDQ